MIDGTFSQKVAPGNTGMMEQKMDRMVLHEPVECVKANELIGLYKPANVGPHVE
jgi:hypothetical protein